MYHDILKLLDLHGLAGVAVRDGSIINANSAAYKLLPELTINSPAEELFPLYKEASMTGAPTALSFKSAGETFDASVSRCGDYDIITAKPNTESEISPAENFASSVSTAIKDTLSTCGMAASFLRGYAERVRDLSFEKYYSMAAHSYFSLLRIASNISEFENRSAPLHDPEPIDVIGLLSELIDSVNQLPGNSFAHIGFYSELQYFYVNGVRDELERMFLNILSNSLKYTPASGKITVTASRERNYIKIITADTGCGISQEIMASVFSRYTIQKEFTASKHGIGIGLPAARNIAVRHGGGIMLTSREGEGTQVYITLPGVSDPTAFHSDISEYRTSGSRNILSGLADVLGYESYTIAYTE